MEQTHARDFATLRIKGGPYSGNELILDEFPLLDDSGVITIGDGRLLMTTDMLQALEEGARDLRTYLLDKKYARQAVEKEQERREKLLEFAEGTSGKLPVECPKCSSALAETRAEGYAMGEHSLAVYDCSRTYIWAAADSKLEGTWKGTCGP